MKCKCGTEMIISEWDGWVWMCFYCDYVGRKATDEEIKELEIKPQVLKDALKKVESL